MDAINPPYYQRYPKEAIDMMMDIFGRDAVAQYCLINAMKYRLRIGHKDDLQQELEKEEWYLNKYHELKLSPR